jgi:hypothetical protein
LLSFFYLVALVGYALRTGRRLLASELGFARNFAVSQSLFLLLQVLALMLFAEFTAIDARPGFVNLAVGFPAELELLIIRLPREDDAVHVAVLGVAMEGIYD